MLVNFYMAFKCSIEGPLRSVDRVVAYHTDIPGLIPGSGKKDIRIFSNPPNYPAESGLLDIIRPIGNGCKVLFKRPVSYPKRNKKLLLVSSELQG